MNTNLVFIAQGKVWTDSLKLATEFNKRHADVLEKIEKQLTEYSESFTSTNFSVDVQLVEIGQGARRESKFYRLTRDGFMAVAMTFTGKKAAAFREVVLTEFNRMEAKLLDVGLQAAPITIDDFYRLAKEQEARAERAEAENRQLKNYAADAATENGLTSAKILKLYPAKAQTLIEQAKAQVKKLERYGPTGLLTVGLKLNGITTTVSVNVRNGLPAKLFNAQEVHEFMTTVKEVK